MIIPAHLKEFSKIFKQQGATLYVVGGYVRNTLLNIATNDIDICSAMPPEVFANIKKEGVHIEQKAYGLGTFCVIHTFSNKKYIYEYTSFREDNYGRGHSHTPNSIAFVTDINFDAKRRDFTVNALYANMQGEVLDPTGFGIKDVENKILRSVAKETLSSDALRILRLVRFYGELNFSVESQTLKDAKSNIDGLKDVSKERIREEFFKILVSDAKYGKKNMLKTLFLLKGLNAYPYIVPILWENNGFLQNAKYHKYNVFDHSLHTCAVAPADLVLRLSALLHDIGKKYCFLENGNMHMHAQMGKTLAKEELEGLKTNSVLIKEVCLLIKYHMFDLDNKAGRTAVLKVIATLGEEHFSKLIIIRESDFAGSGMGAVAKSKEKWHNILTDLKKHNAPIQKSKLAVNGDDIMKELNIAPGKDVGEILNKLHLLVLKKPKQNIYKNLIKYAKMMYINN